MALLPEDPQQRTRAILGLLATCGLAVLGYMYVYAPRAEAVADLREHAEALEVQNRTARAVVQSSGEDDVERRLASYRDQLGVVEGLIPSSEELPVLLDRISEEARSSGVDLSLIRPAQASREEYYTRRVYDLAVLGSYHQIGDFLARIGTLPRIITPIDLSLEPRRDEQRNGSADEREQSLEARFSIETYVIAPEDESPDEEDDE